MFYFLQIFSTSDNRVRWQCHSSQPRNHVQAGRTQHEEEKSAHIIIETALWFREGLGTRPSSEIQRRGLEEVASLSPAPAGLGAAGSRRSEDIGTQAAVPELTASH